MNSLPSTRSASLFPPQFPHSILIRPSCLTVALSVIASLGLILSICSLVSFLPAYVGYCGAGIFCASLIAIFISQRLKPPTIVRNPPMKPVNTEAEPTIKDWQTRLLNFDYKEPIETKAAMEPKESALFQAVCEQSLPALPKDVCTLIFEELSAKSLTRALRVCKEWKNHASQNQLWKRHCLEARIFPPSSSPGEIQWRKVFHEGKALPDKIRTLTPTFQRLSTRYPQEKLITLASARKIIGNSLFALQLNNLQEFKLNSEEEALSLRLEQYCSGGSYFMEYMNEVLYCIEPLRHDSGFEIYPVDLKNKRLAAKEVSVECTLPEPSTLPPLAMCHQLLFIGNSDGTIDVGELNFLQENGCSVLAYKKIRVLKHEKLKTIFDLKVSDTKLIARPKWGGGIYTWDLQKFEHISAFGPSFYRDYDKGVYGTHLIYVEDYRWEDKQIKTFDSLTGAVYTTVIKIPDITKDIDKAKKLRADGSIESLAPPNFKELTVSGSLVFFLCKEKMLLTSNRHDDKELCYIYKIRVYSLQTGKFLKTFSYTPDVEHEEELWRLQVEGNRILCQSKKENGLRSIYDLLIWDFNEQAATQLT